jgi:L-serine dehydratase
LREWTAYCIGGGEIIDDENPNRNEHAAYPKTCVRDILEWCYDNGRQFCEYVAEDDSPELWPQLTEAWKVMTDAIYRGLKNKCVLL